MEWQPIETAPKDGEFFLAYQYGYGVQKTSWNGWDNYGVGGFIIYASHGWKPTHWMPLPEPPKD